MHGKADRLRRSHIAEMSPWKTLIHANLGNTCVSLNVCPKTSAAGFSSKARKILFEIEPVQFSLGYLNSNRV